MYANKWDNLDKLNKFLKMQKLSRFTQEKIENINKAITTKEAKSVLKKKNL